MLPGKLCPEGGIEPAIKEWVVAGGGHGDDVREEEADVVIRPTSCNIIFQIEFCGNFLSRRKKIAAIEV